jgi:glycosyltransferase involved in cell wall biosynthesis
MVYFGGFRDYKRPWIPVELYCRFKDEIPHLRLVMIGNGPSLPRIQVMLRSGGLTNVEMVGRVSDERLASLVSSAWLNVHCSVSEGWGYSILESAAAGTPTVAYAVPGVSETVQGDRNGITVRDGDFDALASAARTILLDHEKWIVRSREFAEQFTWQEAASKWESHLQAVSCNCL